MEVLGYVRILGGCDLPLAHCWIFCEEDFDLYVRSFVTEKVSDSPGRQVQHMICFSKFISLKERAIGK